MKRNDILEKETEIRRWISEHRSKAFMCRQLHCKPTTLETYLEKLGIVYKGNQGGQGRRSAQRKPAVAYLYKGSMIKAHELKLKLIRDGIKLAKCESCNLSTWFNTAIPLELHHMNGDRFDNRLENLQILCPNCHALTHSYSDKMHKKLAQHFKLGEVEQLISENKLYQPVSVLVFDSPESYARWQETHLGLQQLVEKGSSSLNVPARQEACLHCGKPLTLPGQDTYCSRQCSRLAARKVERPSKKDLQHLVWTKPTTQIAKDFGVSDKAVEKWCKAYGIEKPQRGYWAKKQAQSLN